VSIRRASDGAETGRIDPATSMEHLTIDPDGGFVYLAETRTGGGLGIHRYRLDGTGDTTLISLDARFTPDGIPADHYGSLMATDGAFVTFACTDESCRLWRTMPGKPAGKARILDVPKLCTIVGATGDRLIAYDDARCHVDTGDGDFPLRTIDLATGASSLLSTRPQLQVARSVTVDGTDLLVATHRSGDGSTSDVVTLDARTGAQRAIITGLSNDHPDVDGWFGVAPQALPGAWVLVQRGGAGGIDTPGARGGWLVDLASGRTIELPSGTVGWS
jgi:hypothetical protein